MSMLFSEVQLGPVKLNNRIVIAPMCQYSAVDGLANPWHLMHLGNLTLSGAAALIIEATAVEDIGRISDGCLGLWSEQHAIALKHVIDTIKPIASTKLFIQLSHAGRKASSHKPWETGKLIDLDAGGWETTAPSAISHNPDERPPLALDAAGLIRVREAFVQTAKRSVEIGLEGIELHCAHGYLLHEFLSPISNQRTDEYGGTAENRMRFPLSVFEAVRAAIPKHIALGVRLSATDWVEGGWTIAESLVMAQRLEEMGCDFLHVSSGGVSNQQKIPVGPGYQVHLAQEIKSNVKEMPIIAVGLINDAVQAETILQEGKADLVALARGILYDPRWPWHAAATLGAQVEAPPQYWRCQPAGLSKLFVGTRSNQR